MEIAYILVEKESASDMTREINNLTKEGWMLYSAQVSSHYDHSRNCSVYHVLMSNSITK